ncbi:MAG: hypothetical protein DHS20C21_18300 [Gemmatimonadota bacterium]|nr:MAG: hypothetical protein DHS20C21_18300 [Gemmatimonadota bacterium]
MTSPRTILLLAAAGPFAAFGAPPLASAEPCCSTSTHHAARIVAQTPDGHWLEGESPEVYGRHWFRQPVGQGWVFALVPQEHGWSIRLYDSEGADAVDLSAITPPHGGPVNPRDVFGWHFRNADNTGPNVGDVNAPQGTREFFFSRAISGTGGFKPSADPDSARWAAPDSSDGLGWFRVLDYGLSDLEPGGKARMTYLKFDACLRWPKSEEEIQREADDARFEFLPEDLETYGSCGLDLLAYDLHAAFVPRQLVGDLDGDDAFDEIAQIRRKRDGKRGLAVCRAGTWLHVLGMDGGMVGEALAAGYFDQMEAWRLMKREHGPLGYVDEPPWPDSDGDVLVLERIEKEMILLYWKEGALHSQQVYRYVEP